MEVIVRNFSCITQFPNQTKPHHFVQLALELFRLGIYVKTPVQSLKADKVKVRLLASYLLLLRLR